VIHYFLTPAMRPSLKLFLLVNLLAAAACTRRGDDPSDPAILVLGQEEVRRSDFDEHIAKLAQRGHDVDAGLREALLQPFLEERVLVLQARSQRLVKPGATPEEERTAVEALLARSLPVIQVPDDEVERYYREHAESFRHPQQVTLHQILVPTENEARDVRRRLQRDPKSFEILARTRSRSPEASTGGLMGTFEPGQLPSELESAAFNLAVGATSEAIQTPLGYHLLWIDARTQEREEPLAECAGRVRTQLERARTEEAVRSFVQQLMSRAKVNHEIALRMDHRP
jgi:parvulin-like peptidyl-prolyl isomerase